MIDIEKKEFLNPPLTGLDNRVSRDAFADLKRSKSANGLTYLGFLKRLYNRNLMIRKQEFEDRRIVLDGKRDKNIIDAINEMKKEADKIGKNKKRRKYHAG